MKAIERIYIYLDYKNITPAAFERAAGISNGYLSKQLSRKADIGESILLQIIDYCPEISFEWLLKGQGEMLKEKTAPVKAIAHLASQEKGLPLIPVTAFAGFGLVTFEDLQVEHYYDVPDFKQADFLIRMKGNSMYPKYSSGDIIACAIVKETLFFQWNKIYAVLTNSQGILIKRVKKSTLPDNILLFSDNAAYDPFDVPIRDILKIALVIGSIRVE